MATGSISPASFVAAIEEINLAISYDEKKLLTEYYTLPNKQQEVNYRKFLEDLRVQADEGKTLLSLTVEQRELYHNVTSFIKSKNKINMFVGTIREKDISSKGYLSKLAIQDAYSKVGLNLSPKQFSALFGALDTNQMGEHNYK